MKKSSEKKFDFESESTIVAGLYRFKVCVVNCTKKVVGGV